MIIYLFQTASLFAVTDLVPKPTRSQQEDSCGHLSRAWAAGDFARVRRHPYLVQSRTTGIGDAILTYLYPSGGYCGNSRSEPSLIMAIDAWAKVRDGAAGTVPHLEYGYCGSDTARVCHGGQLHTNLHTAVPGVATGRRAPGLSAPHARQCVSQQRHDFTSR